MRHAIPTAALALTLALACVRKDAPQRAASAPIPRPTFDNRIYADSIPPTGGVNTTNPDAADTAAAREGAQLFTAMNCDGCHGGGATGWVGPSLTDGRWRYGGSDAEVFLSIYYGRPKGMPAFGGLLPPDVVWKLVTYVKTQPMPKDVPTERW